MGNDLVKLYKELGVRNQSEDITQIRNEISEKLKSKMREHFLDLLDIGSVVGYKHLKEEMQAAVDLVDMMDKSKQKD